MLWKDQSVDDEPSIGTENKITVNCFVSISTYEALHDICGLKVHVHVMIPVD